MKNLVVNCGSSSLKFQLIDTSKKEIISKGGVERIGSSNTFLKIVNPKINYTDKRVVEVNNHIEAVKLIMQSLLTTDAIKSYTEIQAIGHRVVHGGMYKTPMLVTEEVISTIEDLNKFAPLHNKISASVMREFMKIFPDKPQVAVFDTSFHQTLAETEYKYAIPEEFSEVRKYGAHGINHEYVAKRVREILGDDTIKFISCHLGNGSSLCAIDENGKSVDTTMGLGPLGGLIMGTRSGDLDPTVINYIATKNNISAQEVFKLLNYRSGMAALSGVGSDFIDIEGAAMHGNERAELSLEIYSRTVAKYIAQMEVTLQGCDMYVFTAGIGEKSPIVRKKICDILAYKGVKINERMNNLTFGNEGIISAPDSRVIVMVIPANEELMIAQKTEEIING